MDSTSSDLAKAAGEAAQKLRKVVVQDINPLAVLREYCEYRKATEGEETRREEIRARRDVAVSAIQAQKELIETYFCMCFKERSKALEHLFGVLSHAVDTKNDAELDTALNGILGVVGDSPLKDFEAFRTARLEGEIIEI